jgi:peptide/nickel transport system substrate-binding protein
MRRIQTRTVTRLTLVAACALLVGMLANGGGTAGASTIRPRTKPPGQGGPSGIVRWAEAPSSTPNWIFPFMSLRYYSIANQNQFQYLMYRPLCFFDQTNSSHPSLNASLSLAHPPVFSDGDRTVTVELKGWRFSNGQLVDAQSVIFSLNMLRVEKGYFGGYTPGHFPDNLASYSATSPTSETVTLRLNHAWNTMGFLYNALSGITPMPEAWDIRSLHGKPGSGGCGSIYPTLAVVPRARRCGRSTPTTAGLTRRRIWPGTSPPMGRILCGGSATGHSRCRRTTPARAR